MRISDLINLAIKNLKGKWAVLPVIGFAITVFCLCFAGAILTTVQEEKAQPYEVILSARGNADITDSTIADILKITDVKAATPILQVPVTIKTGKYAAQLTLTGMDAGYLDGIYAQGSVFPADSVMPYILLNEAACKQFVEEGKAADKEQPNIAWLNAGCSLLIGEESFSVTSKVCGILSDGDAKDVEPAAYVSLPVAKELLRKSGQPTDEKTAWVRIANIGYADVVSKQIAALGLNVTNSNEQMQTEWDTETREMVYLLVISAFCLLCSTILLTAHRDTTKQKQKEAFEILRLMGMKEREVSRLFVLNALIIAMIGTAIGIAVSFALPSFLPMELSGASTFTLHIPLEVAVISMVISVVAGLVPSIREQI